MLALIRFIGLGMALGFLMLALVAIFSDSILRGLGNIENTLNDTQVQLEQLIEDLEDEDQ